jgi:hypothetical protein
VRGKRCEHLSRENGRFASPYTHGHVFAVLYAMNVGLWCVCELVAINLGSLTASVSSQPLIFARFVG